MQSELIRLDVVACERVLIEADGVPSAIRILDLVFVDESIPPDQRPPFNVSLLIRGRFPAGEPRACVVNIGLIRPSGERVALQEHSAPAADKFEDSPTGFNMVCQLGIVPRNLGTCFIYVSVEEKEATFPITFVRAESDPHRASVRSR